MLRLIAKLLAILNSETAPGQISLAFCIAMVMGLTPLMSLHNLLFLLLVLLLRANLSAFLLGLGFFTGLAYLFDPLFHRIGHAVLTSGGLESLWTALYNNPFTRITRFNNTIVMGSLLSSLALFIPLYFLSNLLILRYRSHVLDWVRRSRVMTALKASKFYGIYEKVRGLKEGGL